MTVSVHPFSKDPSHPPSWTSPSEEGDVLLDQPPGYMDAARMHPPLTDSKQQPVPQDDGYTDDFDIPHKFTPSSTDLGWKRGEYRPSYELDEHDNIISHDTRLSNSSATLLRFLQRQSAKPPRVKLEISGHTPMASDDSRFNFVVPATFESEAGLGANARPSLFVEPEWILALRGKGSGEETLGVRPVAAERSTFFGLRGSRDGYNSVPGSEDLDLEANVEEPAGTAMGEVRMGEERRVRVLKEQDDRTVRGWPRFAHPASAVDMAHNTRHSFVPPTATNQPPLVFQSHFVDLDDVHRPDSAFAQDQEEEVRSVLEAYCRSYNPLRELVVETDVYGWDASRLKDAVSKVIANSNNKPTTTIMGIFTSSEEPPRSTVRFVVEPHKITIRPNNFFSRQFSATEGKQVWMSFLLGFFLLLLLAEYVFGRRFYHIRVSHPLTRWRPLPPPSTSSTHTHTSALDLARTLTARSPKVAQLPDGTWVYLVGVQEGEWLRKWEEAIVEAVRARKNDCSVLKEENGLGSANTALRGYEE